jgi:hypothetical protein
VLSSGHKVLVVAVVVLVECLNVKLGRTVVGFVVVVYIEVESDMVHD